MRRHSGARAVAGLALAGLGLSLAGCIGQYKIDFDSAEFLDRIRLDRNGLTPEQREECTVGCERPGEGTFRTAPDRLIAEIHPADWPGPASPDLLPMADCLWIAHSQNDGNGDAIVLHWEMVGKIDRGFGSGERIAPGTEVITSCRINHPVDRQPPCHGDPDEHGEICPPLDPVTTNEPGVYTGVLWDNYFPPDGALVEHEGRFFYLNGDLLVAGPALLEDTPAPPTNEDGACGSIPFFGGAESWVTSGFKGFDGPSTADGRVSACSGPVGYRLRPSEDATYRLTCPQTWVHCDRTLAPNIMVVAGSRRIARRMTPLEGKPLDWRWRTPVDPATDRWQETFTPNVQVSTVRLLRRDASGAETPLQPGEVVGDELCVLDNPVLACRHTCSGRGLPGEGLVFDLRDDAACTGTALTPTYDVEPFGGGLQPLRPLTWRVELAAPPAPGEQIWIELDLVTSDSPAALMVEPLMDFGDTQVGDEKKGLFEVSNVGGQTLSVEAVTISGPEAGDYSLRLPTGEQMLPLPVEVTPEEDGSFTARRGEDFDELGLLELVEHVGDLADGGRGLLALRQVEYDDQEVAAYGTLLEVDGPATFYRDPGIDFQEIANPPPPLGAPQAGWTRRPLAQRVFRDRGLPFQLLPGEAFDVMVTVEPLGVGEDRTARLRIEASQSSDPGIRVEAEAVLTVDALSGPLPATLPTILLFPRPHSGGAAWQSSLLLINQGQTDLLRAGIAIDGDAAASFALVSTHAPDRVIAPGDMEVLTVEYTPNPCGGSNLERAELQLSTDGGPVVVDLVGDPAQCTP